MCRALGGAAPDLHYGTPADRQPLLGACSRWKSEWALCALVQASGSALRDNSHGTSLYSRLNGLKEKKMEKKQQTLTQMWGDCEGCQNAAATGD